MPNLTLHFRDGSAAVSTETIPQVGHRVNLWGEKYAVVDVEHEFSGTESVELAMTHVYLVLIGVPAGGE